MTQAHNPNEQIRRLNEAATWGANFVRLLLDSSQAYTSSDGSSRCAVGYYTNPDSFVTNDASYMSAIKAIVDQAALNNQYVLVTVWQDPSFTCNDNNDPSLTTSQHNNNDDIGWEPTGYTVAVWQNLVTTFASYPNVLFGLSNEPHGGYTSTVEADNVQIRDDMNYGVQVIRNQETSVGSPHPHLIAVQSNNYSGSAAYYVDNQMQGAPPNSDGSNVIYEVHMYSDSSDGDWWNNIFVPAQTIPVFIGEYGPAAVADGDAGDWLCGGQPVDSSMTIYDIPSFQSDLRSAGIPYLAWAFDPYDLPSIFYVNETCGGGPECNSLNFSNITSWGQLVKEDLASSYGSATTPGGTTTTGTTSTTTGGGGTTAIVPATIDSFMSFSGGTAGGTTGGTIGSAISGTTGGTTGGHR